MADSNNNSILAGTHNEIGLGSQDCMIIQGSNNNIPANSDNITILGDGVTNPANDTFYVGCTNGLHCAGDVVAFSSSDERLKEDVSEITNCLGKVLSLDAINFKWNEKQSTCEGRDIGLIAQQVEKIAPEIVQTRKSGYKAIKYEKIIPLLVGAIQEQQLEIDDINKELDLLLSSQN